MKTIYFVTGLPRSGSTLLCNILNQNPDFHATPTSGLVGVVAPLKKGWHRIAENLALPAEISYRKLENVLRSVFDGFYTDIDMPYIFDKNREWLRHAETLNRLFPDVKFLVTVRDMRQVLSSLEKLFRKTAELGITFQELRVPVNFQTVESRALFWTQNDQILGAPYLAIKDALARGYKKQMHFVDYKDLTKSPRSTFEAIYRFLDLPEYTHDFENVVQSTFEDDRIHGFAGLHRIRSKVEYTNPDYEQILGKELSNRFKDEGLW